MNIVIIGAGAAGISAVETIRKHNKDYEITVVSKDRSLPFSPVALPEYIEGRIPKEQLFLWDDRFIKKSGVNFIPGKAVVNIKPYKKEVILDDGAVLSYDKLLIASGASPALPAHFRNIKGVFTLRTPADAETIRHRASERMFIYGAGAIAIKIAVALRRMGIDVILLCRSRVLRRLFNEDICRLIHGLLVANGIRIIRIQEAPHLIGDPVERVRIGAEEFKCDGIIAALGVVPNTSFVDERAVSLGTSGAIMTNQRLETSAVDVYAAGDCIETLDIISGERQVMALWPPAVEQARVAALNMLGIGAIYEGTLSQNVIDVFDTPLASIGSVDGEKIDISKRGTISRFTIKDEKVIGAQLVGEIGNAGFISSCIRKGINTKDLERLELLFPGRVHLLTAVTCYQLFRRT
jgi:NADPH-dependent 2,4-dienoyl-CoA reductase/sulfur reductase-like enzyme